MSWFCAKLAILPPNSKVKTNIYSDNFFKIKTDIFSVTGLALATEK